MAGLTLDQYLRNIAYKGTDNTQVITGRATTDDGNLLLNRYNDCKNRIQSENQLQRIDFSGSKYKANTVFVSTGNWVEESGSIMNPNNPEYIQAGKHSDRGEYVKVTIGHFSNAPYNSVTKELYQTKNGAKSIDISGLKNKTDIEDIDIEIMQAIVDEFTGPGGTTPAYNTIAGVNLLSAVAELARDKGLITASDRDAIPELVKAVKGGTIIGDTLELPETFDLIIRSTEGEIKGSRVVDNPLGSGVAPFSLNSASPALDISYKLQNSQNYTFQNFFNEYQTSDGRKLIELEEGTEKSEYQKAILADFLGRNSEIFKGIDINTINIKDILGENILDYLNTGAGYTSDDIDIPNSVEISMYQVKSKTNNTSNSNCVQGGGTEKGNQLEGADKNSVGNGGTRQEVSKIGAGGNQGGQGAGGNQGGQGAGGNQGGQGAGGKQGNCVTDAYGGTNKSNQTKGADDNAAGDGSQKQTILDIGVQSTGGNQGGQGAGGNQGGQGAGGISLATINNQNPNPFSNTNNNDDGGGEDGDKGGGGNNEVEKKEPEPEG